MRYSPVRGEDRLSFLTGSGWTLLSKGQARHSSLSSAQYECPKHPVRWDIRPRATPCHPSSASPSPNHYFMSLPPVFVMGPKRQGLNGKGWVAGPGQVKVGVQTRLPRLERLQRAGAGHIPVPRKALSTFPVSSENHNPEIKLVSFNLARIFHSVKLHCQPSPPVLRPATHLLTAQAVASRLLHGLASFTGRFISASPPSARALLGK